MTLDVRAVRRALRAYRHAPVADRAFVVARYLIAPWRPLVEETRGVRGRMLSLGSGFAAIERYVVEINPHVRIEGVDLDPRKVDLVNALPSPGGRLTMRCGDATALDAPAGAYDAVFVCDALHHFAAESHQPLAAAIGRTLKPGGVCIVKELDVRPRWKRRWNALHDRIVAGAGPLACRSPSDMAAVFESVGLVAERVERTDRRWVPYAHYVLRLRKPVRSATDGHPSPTDSSAS